MQYLQLILIFSRYCLSFIRAPDFVTILLTDRTLTVPQRVLSIVLQNTCLHYAIVKLSFMFTIQQIVLLCKLSRLNFTF